MNKKLATLIIIACLTVLIAANAAVDDMRRRAFASELESGGIDIIAASDRPLYDCVVANGGINEGRVLDGSVFTGVCKTNGLAIPFRGSVEIVDGEYTRFNLHPVDEFDPNRGTPFTARMNRG